MKKCKFAEKHCKNRYYDSTRKVVICRLDEWKRKSGICPYDERIKSQTKKINELKNLKEFIKKEVQ